MSPLNEQHDVRDTDFERSSPHHTLGPSPLQAAPGNHNHDDKYRPITYDPFTTGDTKLTYGPADNVTWFEAGSSLLRTGPTAALFALFGTTYGAEDGEHFNLPDSRDDFLRVASAAKLPGSEDGSNTKVIGANNLPPHTHGDGTYSTDNKRMTYRSTSVTPVGGTTDKISSIEGVPGVQGTAANYDHSHDVTGNSGTGNGLTNDPLNIEPKAHYLRLLIHV